MTQESPILRAVTIGTFDGVHLGHRAVISRLRAEARHRDLVPAVVTFSSHPLSVIAPERAPGAICSMAEKIRLLCQEGVEVMTMDFTPEMMRLTAAEWLRMLRDEHGVRLVVLGHDNTFGSDGRSMSYGDYLAIGRELGIEMVVARELPGHSSSRARKALREGDVESAARILGRPWSIEGEVIEGDRLGRTIGFPTANLDPAAASGLQLPAYGVYLSQVRLSDGEVFAGITDIGVRPSVNDRQELRIETHLLDFDRDIYGCRITVSLLTRIRPEKRFGSLQELREAIAADEAEARRLYPSAAARAEAEATASHRMPPITA